jgi:hypothetical protein
MAVATAPTPAERLHQIRRAHQLADGTVVIPLACGDCHGRNLDTNREGDVTCLGCGRITTLAHVRKVRRHRIARFIRTGQR